MPKCGGSSIRTALDEAYGSRLKRYYLNPVKKHSKRILPFILRPRWINNRETGIVYGHFCFDQFGLYSLFKPVQKAMFFRNPIDLFCSSYFYSKEKHGKKFENVTLQEYAEQNDIKNIFDLFLGRTKVKELKFVGLLEQFEPSAELYGKIFDVKLPIHHVNRTKNRPIDYKRYLEDNNMLEFVISKLDKNIRIYNEAKNKFMEMAVKYNIDLNDNTD